MTLAIIYFVLAASLTPTILRGIVVALREHKVNDRWAFDAMLLALLGIAMMITFIEGGVSALS